MVTWQGRVRFGTEGVGGVCVILIKTKKKHTDAHTKAKTKYLLNWL